MDSKLIQEISKRVRQVQKEKADESVLAAHLDAIAEVHDTDRATVESIARQVIDESHTPNTRVDVVQVRNIVWISALVLIMISVIWLLYDNTQTVRIADQDGLTKNDVRTLSYLSEALASMNVAKIVIIEHYQATGALPKSFAEVGVEEGDLITNKYIKRLQLTDDGALKAQLSNLIGDQYYIKLKPVHRLTSEYLEWDCRSNLEPKLLDEHKACTPDV